MPALDINQDIDSMPDSNYKYKIIVERAKQGKGQFEDKQFPPTDESLGPDVRKRFGAGSLKWNRLSAPDTRFKIFADGIEATDIKQGMCGDCYFLSAIAVMGDKFTREKFIFLNTEDEWIKTGAFCVQFYNDGEKSIVIVDDHFPQRDGEFVFGRATDRYELWPNILEKAWAKRFGSFEIIEGGHVHLALAELTNGVPRLILTEKEKNLKKLWNELVNYQKEGAMLGAGSNSHEFGDSATSPMGIVQGHAFSILRIAEVDGAKLLQVRNPWGKGEWKGDWSDRSAKWTTRNRNLLNWHDVKDEGIFWIDINDYVREFDSIYVCRDFTDAASWKTLEINDSWTGSYAEGLPNSGNPRAKMEKSPQYGLTVTKPCKAVVVLRLKDKKERDRAKHYGYVNIQANNGQLIRAPNKTKQLGTIGPRNDTCQACEIDFSTKHSYPCLFTLIVSNMEHGEAGEGDYQVSVYLKDFNATCEKLN